MFLHIQVLINKNKKRSYKFLNNWKTNIKKSKSRKKIREIKAISFYYTFRLNIHRTHLLI